MTAVINKVAVKSNPRKAKEGEGAEKEKDKEERPRKKGARLRASEGYMSSFKL
jgi:hypothetical protein